MEIIIVLGIIGILVGVIVNTVAGAGEKAKKGLTNTKASTLYGKIAEYQLSEGKALASLDVLDAGVEAVKDAWGNRFCYKPPAAGNQSTVIIGSNGGKGGTEVILCYVNGAAQDKDKCDGCVFQ